MKFSLKSYHKPTPLMMRKFGDSLLAASSFSVTFSVVESNRKLAIIALIAGVVGKFLSNFFEE